MLKKIMNKLFDIEDDDIELYTKDYYNLVESYNIPINTQYQFIYDEFMNHIITDTIKKYEKIKIPLVDPNKSKLVGFRSCFYQHFQSKEWYYKLMTPEKCPEVIKRLRNYKLEKINKNYGN